MGDDRGPREALSFLNVKSYHSYYVRTLTWNPLGLVRKRFEIEKIGGLFMLFLKHSQNLSVSKAPDDVEREDLNFYYANYSRIVRSAFA